MSCGTPAEELLSPSAGVEEVQEGGQGVRGEDEGCKGERVLTYCGEGVEGKVKLLNMGRGMKKRAWCVFIN